MIYLTRLKISHLVFFLTMIDPVGGGVGSSRCRRFTLLTFSRALPSSLSLGLYRVGQPATASRRRKKPARRPSRGLVRYKRSSRSAHRLHQSSVITMKCSKLPVTVAAVLLLVLSVQVYGQVVIDKPANPGLSEPDFETRKPRIFTILIIRLV